MLDTTLLEQLKQHFSSLESSITLEVAETPHSRGLELKDMLADIASCSSKIDIKKGSINELPAFSILRNGAPTGIHFRGIPGGHEFTSLILAILNSDGKGKLPDQGFIRRVEALKGPINVRTYISLSCTNCPDVVQALNLMATFNASFSHTMVDGGLAEAEVAQLGIQGVPTVVNQEGRILHVGKSTLAELLDKLEETYGSEATSPANTEVKKMDVVVVGGGPAGVAAAIYSARKGLKTAIIAEKIGGQVQETKGIENLISIPYTEGPELAANLDKHLRHYEIDILEHRRVEAIENGDEKTLILKGGECLKTDALIIATGAKWRELGVPGEKEYLGRGVAFCPHCDGPFYKGKRVAVVGGGNSGVEAAIDLAGICSHVTLFEFAESLKADEVLIKNLRALPNVNIITSARTTEVVGNGENVIAIRYQDRQTETQHEIELDGIFVQIGLAPNSALVKNLVETNRFGEILIDEKCRTQTAGIYAAGDVTTVPYKQIAIAMGEGAKAALSAFEDRIRK